MSAIRATLVTDGSSDKVLVRPLAWLLRECGCRRCSVTWADSPNPTHDLEVKIKDALELYPCEVLFIHRDAEAKTIRERKKEIETALKSEYPHVCVIPVRMTEAWMLFDEQAIRRAAGNPYGRHPLNLPEMKNVECLPDPKEILFEALKTASEYTGRRLRRFDVYGAAHLVFEHVADFSPMRHLAAFQDLEKQVRTFLKNR